MTAPYPVTCDQRDRLKKDYPRQYAEMLELVIAGKVIIVDDAAPGAKS